MKPKPVVRKWRPPLALIIGGTLLGVLFLPIAALFLLREMSPYFGWNQSFLILGAGVVLATALLGYLLRRLIQRPVYGLTNYARALRQGRHSAPPDRFGTPELQDLGRAVIDMGATLEGRAAQLRAYANHVTHELKSPLTALRGSAELLETAEDAGTRRSLTRSISEAATRMETLLEELQEHARAGQSSGPGQTLLGGLGETLGIIVVQDALLPISEKDLETILLHLVQNARAHGANNIRVLSDGHSLDVIDDGSGVADGDKTRVFDPFFTTRRASGGTGMGLSIVQSLCQSNGADIALIDSESGAHFRITFAS
jgi:signal transduction histidine kinase